MQRKEQHDNLSFFRGLPLAVVASLFIAWTAWEVVQAIAQLIRWAR